MNRRSSRRLLAALCLTVSAPSFPEAAGQNPARQADVPAPGPAQRAVLDRYCVTCHNSRAKSGGLVLEKIGVVHHLNFIPATEIATNARISGMNWTQFVQSV